MRGVQKVLQPEASLSAPLLPSQAEPCKETVSSYQGSNETPRHNPDHISKRFPRVLRLKSPAWQLKTFAGQYEVGEAGVARQKRAGK